MRRFRMVIIMVMLAVVPLGVGLVVYSWTPGEVVTVEPSTPPAPPPPPPPETRMVLAAARDLPLGTLLREEDLAEIEVVADAVRRGYVVVEDPTAAYAVRGHAVREAIGAGAPLSWSAVVGPGQRGFLAAVLRPGTRAVTISLGPAASHAGLIDPGDRVDVILTAALRLENDTQGVFTRTILEGVRVVAIDRFVERSAESLERGGAVERTEIVTATLEVSPAQASRLAHGQQEGRLSLAVRALAGAGPEHPTEAVDLPQLMSLPTADTEPEPEEEITLDEVTEPDDDIGTSTVKSVRVIRGREVSEEYFPEPDGLLPAGTEIDTETGADAASAPKVRFEPSEPNPLTDTESVVR